MKVSASGIKDFPQLGKIGVDRLMKRLFDEAGLDEYSINVCFVDGDSMRELYHRFKNQDRVTDVLSFPIPEMERTFAHSKFELGDIVICVDQALLQAKEFGHSLEEEIAVLCAHGLFHLLGYDHERSEDEAALQMQAEMQLLERAGFLPQLSLIGRAF